MTRILFFLLTAIAALGGPGLRFAAAHSWYPWECCSDLDCKPVAVDRVQTTPAGYLLDDGTVIAFKDARPSPDGRFHVCRRDSGSGSLIRLYGKPACFWAPIGAS